MAHTVVFSDIIVGITAQTAPVTSAEVGINPQIVAGFTHPPPYAGSPPSLGVANSLANILFDDQPPAQASSPSLGTLNGFIIGGFEDQLYDRIHLIPSIYALGNVLSEETRDFDVWNAWRRTSKTLSAINETGTTGIDLTQPSSPPLVYSPIQLRSYTITISELGPTTIEAEYEFDFTSEAPVLLVTGTRIVTFAHIPQRPIRERLEFKTDIMEAYDGREQRIRARKLPRQQFEYEYLLIEDNERSKALNALYGFHGSFFAVPVFIYMRSLLVDAEINDTSIQVDTTNADFRDSTTTDPSLIILWRDHDDFEIAQIAVGGIAAGQIDLERPLDQDHDAATTYVIPIQVMLGRDPVEWSRRPTGATSLRIGWLSEDVADLGDLSGLPTHDSLPVLADFNFIDRTLEEKVTRKYELFDSESGTFEAIVGRIITELGTAKGFEARGAADTWTLREILYGLNGKQTSFFLPSWRQDFNLITTIGSADVNLDVDVVDYERFIDTQDPYGDIMIQLKDGTQFFRNITNVVQGTSPTREVLTINASLGQIVTANDIAFFCYLNRVRLNVDKIEIEHTRLNEISVRVPVAGVIE